MIIKSKCVSLILNNIGLKNIVNIDNKLKNKIGRAFAPSNIALIKYWGKSNTELNIPNTDSLSISLGNMGADTSISIYSNNNDSDSDLIILNGTEIDKSTDFYIRVKNYLDLFRDYKFNNHKVFDYKYKITTNINIPVAAGLASSACGFAALILAFDDLFNLNLEQSKLSILARLGSGSACRSLWHGFVYWQKGNDTNGLDSYGYKLDISWPELCIGILIVSADKKSIGSTTAMLRTVETSVLYNKGWIAQVERDLDLIKQALNNKDFELLGSTAENNSLSMHATMLAAKPAICYYNKETIEAMQKVWELRRQGINIYFTMDAGPNLKLIFQEKDVDYITKYFANLKLIKPF
jgi:diphosphomevalonate decarboxylase